MSSIQNFGRFIASEGCFELTEEPPRKWNNFHFNKVGEYEMVSEVSNIGDGQVFIRDGAGRLTNLVSWDSKYVYIRDDETSTVFCPWGAPAPQPVENRSAKYYAAKTVITGTCQDLQATQRVFVPKDFPIEVTTLTVKNLSDRHRKVSLFAYAAFQLTGRDEENNYIDAVNFSEVHPEIGGVFVTNGSSFVPSDRFKGFLVALDGFSGGSGYRDNFTRSEFSLSTPKILWHWDADNKPGFGGDCVGLVQVKLSVAPGETVRADFLLGQACCVDEVAKLRESLTPEIIDAQCDEQCRIQDAKSEMFRVETGSADSDALMNYFVKKQLHRYLVEGVGFRDNLQNDAAVALFDYPSAEKNTLFQLSSQSSSGAVMQGYRPIRRMQYSDQPAWIMLTVPALICESGDMSLLEREVAFFESDEKASVWEHMLRGMRFLADDLGANGLCDQHYADWNDGLEATQEAGDRESVMVSQQLAYGLLEIEKLAKIIGDSAVQAEASQRYEALAKHINDVAWDGSWYVRTICGDGYRIGSAKNAEGQIYINTQTWAVLSGIASPERAAACMKSVDEMLTVDVGYRICAPSYTTYDPRVGQGSNGTPGHIENGGCYCHAGGFKGVADCMLGRADQAWETFRKLTPDSPGNPVSQSTVEPFSFTNSYTTVPLAYGRAGYPWRTGTAGWATMLLVEWILGARRSIDGLMIDPCLTASIPRAKITRTFRGARYHISLDNSAGRCIGVTSIVCDGQKIDGNILPVFKDGQHNVEVVI